MNDIENINCKEDEELKGQMFFDDVFEEPKQPETISSEMEESEPLYYKTILDNYYLSEPDVTPEIQTTAKKGNFALKMIAFLFSLIIIFLSCVAVSNFKEKLNTIPNVIVYNTPEYEIEYKEHKGQILSATQIANKCKPSNVAIITYKGKTVDGTGSGVVMCTDESKTYTYIVTCAHVINDNDTKIVVKTFDGKNYDGEIVGYDNLTDLGVIKIKANRLQLAEFGNSDKMVSGCTVYAIGNPGGAEYFGSMTTGIISDIERPVKTASGYKYNCIQHDAAVNPGSSGGMLINEYGQVIGINSQKVTVSSYEGMSFAVPMSMVIPVISNIINSYIGSNTK